MVEHLKKSEEIEKITMFEIGDKQINVTINERTSVILQENGRIT